MNPTHAWRAIWGIGIVGSLTVLDLHREQEDIKAGRDYVSGTTFSCFCRWLIGIIPGGRDLFDFGLDEFHRWFHGHILSAS